MKLSKIALILMAVFTLDLFLTPLVRATPKVQFSIVYTNDVMGEVEPCG